MFASRLATACVALFAARVAAAGELVECPAEYEEEFMPVIQRDLLPWVGGISEELFRNTVAYAMQGETRGNVAIGRCSAASILILNGTVTATYSEPDCNQTAAWPFVDAFPQYLATIAVEMGLPDTVFVISTADKNDNDNYHTHFNATLRPIFHFCRTVDAADILVESHVVHMAGGLGLELMREKLREHPPPDWSDKRDVLFGAWTTYGRWVPHLEEPATLRYNLDGEVDYNSRLAVENVGRQMNDSRVQINTNGFVHNWEWANFRYIVHVDGVTCSNKIFESLLTGSLVFVEQSGYQCLPQAHLRPFVHYVPFYQHFPQELIWAWEWVNAHPGLAQSIAAAGKAWADNFLAKKALKCRWRLLLREYNRLLRFDPVAYALAQSPPPPRPPPPPRAPQPPRPPPPPRPPFPPGSPSPIMHPR